MIDEVWKATIGFTGGTGNLAIGTCGAMDGAAAAISYSFGLAKTDADYMKMLKIVEAVGDVGTQIQKKYSHIQCQEIQFHHWGKSYRFSNPKAREEFVSFARASLVGDDKEMTSCQEVSGDAAPWAVEKILEHNPQFSRRKQQ